MNDPDLEEQIRELWRQNLDVAPTVSTRSHRMSTPALVAAAVVVAALVAGIVLIRDDGSRDTGVATNGPDTSENVVPEGAVLPTALSEPGTALGNGFEVADGSVLIGAPVPLGITVVLDGEPVVDEGWTAYLYVTGNPSDVVNRYIAQAEAEGLIPTAQPDGEVFEMEGEEVPPTGYERCGTLGDGSYACSASAGDNGRRCLAASLVRSDTASHLRLTYMLNATEVSPCIALGGLAVNADLEPPDPPTDWPPLPSLGDEFGTPWGVLAPITVQGGSRMVAAPLPSPDCGGPAVAQVTGDPAEVLDRYVDEFRRVSVVEPVVTPESGKSGNLSLERRYVNESGGGRLFTAELVTTENGAAWLYLNGCQG